MINEKFELLLAKELSGEITQEEHEVFLGLLENDQALKEEYELFKTYWKESESVQYQDSRLFERVKSKIKYFEDQTSGDRLVEMPEITIKRKTYPWLRIAAAFLLFLAASLYFYKNSMLPADNGPLLVKTTKQGVRSEIILADGTKVTLNSGSELKYPRRFDGPIREVHLVGEGFFEVQNDEKHPFIVHTDKMDVKVLGTAFNIKTYPNEKTSETTLIRGSVQIVLLERPSDAIILKPNEKFIVKNTSPEKVGGKIKSSNEVLAPTQYTLTTLTYFEKQKNTIVETSWMQNKLAFSNEDFSAVALKMERWYGVDIQFANDKVAQYRFTALFQKETLKEALDALQMTEDFHYRMDDTTIYIY